MIDIGDKVACVDDSPRPHLIGNTYPNGRIVKGTVYVVEGFITDQFGELALRVIGKPIVGWSGRIYGWRIFRFRKLEELKMEQELEYWRTAGEPHRA
jgi:hypothetical protein